MSSSVLILPIFKEVKMPLVQQEIEESLDSEDSLEEFSKMTPIVIVPKILVRMRQTLLTKPTKTTPLMRPPTILLLLMILLMILHLDQNHLHLLQAL